MNSPRLSASTRSVERSCGSRTISFHRSDSRSRRFNSDLGNVRSSRSLTPALIDCLLWRASNHSRSWTSSVSRGLRAWSCPQGPGGARGGEIRHRDSEGDQRRNCSPHHELGCAFAGEPDALSPPAQAAGGFASRLSHRPQARLAQRSLRMRGLRQQRRIHQLHHQHRPHQRGEPPRPGDGPVDCPPADLQPRIERLYRRAPSEQPLESLRRTWDRREPPPVQLIWDPHRQPGGLLHVAVRRAGARPPLRTRRSALPQRVVVVLGADKCSPVAHRRGAIRAPAGCDPTRAELKRPSFSSESDGCSGTAHRTVSAVGISTLRYTRLRGGWSVPVRFLTACLCFGPSGRADSIRRGISATTDRVTLRFRHLRPAPAETLGSLPQDSHNPFICSS